MTYFNTNTISIIAKLKLKLKHNSNFAYQSDNLPFYMIQDSCIHMTGQLLYLLIPFQPYNILTKYSCYTE